MVAPRYTYIIINTIYLLSTIDEFFEIEQTHYKNENKKNLLGKNIHFSCDWKIFLKQFKVYFDKCEDKTISLKVLDFFKIHIYLPDLRKECFHLEFENSSINQLSAYDFNSRLIHTYNYYSKYITFENIILHPEKNAQIKILREKLTFEDALINNPITISLHYGNMVKSIIMYTTSSMAGEDATILDGTEVVGINQAIVDFQANNDSVIKIQ